MFASFLGQTPQSITIVDMWSLVPPLRSEYPIIVKVTLDCAVRIEDHLRSFAPDLRILYLRDPRDNYQSLSQKHYRDIRGTVLDKLRVLEDMFSRRSELFDLVITYEDFVRAPEHVAGILRARGLAVPENAIEFRRGPQQIAQFATDQNEWCRQNYMKLYGFGNLHFMEWGRLKRIAYPALSEEALAAICSACPTIEAHYASAGRTPRSRSAVGAGSQE